KSWRYADEGRALRPARARRRPAGVRLPSRVRRKDSPIRVTAVPGRGLAKAERQREAGHPKFTPWGGYEWRRNRRAGAGGTLPVYSLDRLPGAHFAGSDGRAGHTSGAVRIGVRLPGRLRLRRPGETPGAVLNGRTAPIRCMTGSRAFVGITPAGRRAVRPSTGR